MFEKKDSMWARFSLEARAVLEHEGRFGVQRGKREVCTGTVLRYERRQKGGPAEPTTGASKRHITGDRAAQAGAKRSIEPTSAFGLRSE